MYVFWDLETVPDTAYVGMPLDGWPPGIEEEEIAVRYVAPKQPPKNWRDPAKIEAWRQREHARVVEAEAEELAKANARHELARRDAWEQWRRGALSPLHVRIVSAAWAIDGGPVMRLADAEDDGMIVAALMDVLVLRGRVTHVGHNIRGYDLPVLRARAMHHQHEVAGLPWQRFDKRVVDTLDIVPCVGYGARGSRRRLGDWCEFLGIEQLDRIDGSGVLDAYVAGDLSAIVEHNISDVAAQRELCRRLGVWS